MIKFGTGGWRAVIGDEFTKANVKLLVQGLCDIFEKDGLKKETVIGFDRRFLSDFAAKWAAEVFAANGVKVRFIGREAPTPMIMFAARQADVPYALAVTASHNPAEYNGIKVFTAGGRDAAKDVTNRIESAIGAVKEVRSVDFEAGRREGLIVDENISNEYIDSILSQIDVEAIKRKNLRVLLDPMFGVSKT
ncbi:MAG: phosphoglucomutase/phosphomannomutase family protein, partial [Clostridia bacterium]|nr:phosphoglucomutase/phosphomannomutase family protein [Clostridia bacterium]